MKKVVIIGANSYIARNVLYVMQKSIEDYEVKLYDNGPNQIDGAKNYEQINVLSKESIKKIDFNCDVIFMFVGKTGSAKGFDEYDLFIDINERALLNILNEYRTQHSQAKIIFPSTRLVYKGSQNPQKEDDEKTFKTIYAINKYACEMYLEQYSHVFGIDYCIFRICVPYGTLIPGASSYGTAEFMLDKATQGKNITLFGDGSVRRTLTYIGDLCEIMIAGAFSEKCINDVFNIGGEDYSLLEMAKLIAKKYNVEIEFVPWPEIEQKIESGDTVFDDTKLRGRIQYKIEKKFEDWIN